MAQQNVILKLSLAIIFLVPSLSLASEVILKSGQKLEGKIVEKTDKYIKLDTGIDYAVTYYFDDIDTIDGKALPKKAIHKVISAPPVAATQPAPLPAKVFTPPVPNIIHVQNDPPQDTAQAPVVDLTQNAQGEINGQPFTVEKAELDTHVKTLKLRQGGNFFADLDFLIFLNLSQGASLENIHLHITPGNSGNNPPIYKEWRVDGGKLPKQKMYGSGYSLDLTLGDMHDKKIHGTINLALPDEQKSHVEGSFDALVDDMPGWHQVGAPSFSFKGMKDANSLKSAVLLGSGMGLIGLLFGLTYIIFPCLCLFIISKKTGRGSPWMGWVPIANMFLMCKIAGIRYSWLWLFLLFFIPFLGPVICFGLCVFIWYKIALVLNKPGWWGILASIPIVNFVAMGYLAFTDN